jgi:hypothetical protein
MAECIYLRGTGIQCHHFINPDDNCWYHTRIECEHADLFRETEKKFKDKKK